MNKQKIQLSQVVFGDIVYWLTITAAIFCMIGSVVAFSSMDSNILNPHFLFANMWAGMGPDAIWETAGKATGGGNWMSYFNAGDGFIQLGLVIGCSIALPAMVVAAFIHILKEKSILWAAGALWIAMMVLVSILGIVSLH